MDFIQNVGQSYLERKAFAAPQMAENMFMKQFKGSDDKKEEEAKAKSTAASHAGSSHSHSHAPTSKKGSTAAMHDKDAEIKSLRKQLDHYSLEEASQGHHDSDDRDSSVGAKSRHVAPSYVSTSRHHKPSHAETRKRSASERPRSSGAVYLEKGGLSRKKSSSRKPSSSAARHESGAAKEAAKLVALDARLEKGGVSTKKKSQAFAEVEEPKPVGRHESRAASRYHSVSESDSDSEDDVRSHHTSRSKATVSDASTVRASRAPSHRNSHSRGRTIEIVSPPASHTPSVISSHHAPSHHSHHDSRSRAPVSIISGHAPSHRESHAPSYYHGASHSLPSHAAPLATIASSRAPSHVHSSRAPPSILSSQAGSHTMASPIVIAPRHSKSQAPSYYHHHKASHSASHAAAPAAVAATIISGAHSHAPSSSHSHHSKAPSSRHISHAPSSHHSKASSHHISHAHGPRSHAAAASTRSRSPDPLDSDSDSLAPSDSITSIDAPSEHGGSAALLHQRERYHRSASRGRVPELPPLEERPECGGQGFVPHRSGVRLKDDGVGGIVEVEVFEGVSGPAPHVREIGRGRERGWGRGMDEGGYVGGGGRKGSVVELGKRRDGALREKRYYKVR